MIIVAIYKQLLVVTLCISLLKIRSQPFWEKWPLLKTRLHNVHVHYRNKEATVIKLTESMQMFLQFIVIVVACIIWKRSMTWLYGIDFSKDRRLITVQLPTQLLTNNYFIVKSEAAILQNVKSIAWCFYKKPLVEVLS